MKNQLEARIEKQESRKNTAWGNKTIQYNFAKHYGKELFKTALKFVLVEILTYNNCSENSDEMSWTKLPINIIKVLWKALLCLQIFTCLDKINGHLHAYYAYSEQEKNFQSEIDLLKKQLNSDNYELGGELPDMVTDQI